MPQKPTGPRALRMQAILQEAFAPATLDIADESARHAGHAGMRGLDVAAGETHFDVHIASARFAGMNRIARHRLVHDVLKNEFETGLHALSLRLEEAPA